MKRVILITLCLLGLTAGMVAAKAHPRVSLNTATTQQLRSLPGIGELLAQRIIARRPFKSVQDLMSIKGITEQRFQRLKPLVGV